MGHGVYVTENLTPLREKLAYEGRQLVRQKVLGKTWVAGCRVKCQRPDQQKTEVIRDMVDIQCLKEGKPLPVYEN